MAEKKILVVDDDIDTQELLTVVLVKEKFGVVSAMNGWDGLVKAREEKPDLILLDLLLPEMQGNDALQALKAMDTTRSIPVIMLTGKSEKDTVLDVKYKGIADYIVKPFDNDVLLQKIRKALGMGETDGESRDKKILPLKKAEEEKKAGGKQKAKQEQEEENIDPALQAKIMKNQHCDAEDAKTSDMLPYEQVMSADLKEGMVLALPLLYANKRPFLNAHTQLTKKHIEKINEKKDEIMFPASVHKNQPQETS